MEIDTKEKAVQEALEALDIKYEITRHKPLFTCADADELELKGMDLKNLLVKDKKSGKFYLVIMRAQDKLDFKAYREQTGWSNKMTFAGDEDLMECLGVTTGACSLFGILNDKEKKVTVVLDQVLSVSPDETIVDFHPNVNTATYSLTFGDAKRFLASQGNETVFMK